MRTARRVRTRRPLFAAAAALVLLTGCSGHPPPAVTDSAPADREAVPAAPASPPDHPVGRDVVTTGDLDVTVTDVVEATERLAEFTVELGGSVEDRHESTGAHRAARAELTLRIPSAKMNDFLSGAKEFGVITTVALNHEDVTGRRVDLDARIAALQTSVDRLTTLMANATSTADLLAAEDALTERQATLDGLRDQRAALGNRISYATITATLAPQSSEHSPGFLASMRHGWHALVAVVGAVVALSGFLLPWLPVLAALIGAGLVWRRGRARRGADSVK
ncbi:DUF4349 domain-containing protein [Mycolicibacillus parakoreensis]|uniref:DUF4349 domain-containing protein n=1 Tax=Mycolicibacillus parakoreensis TaxID=1069221 RepID=A0ABY3TX06_9MYCO|nr:DUF4349 domain-containing protein [Mycolicibacillus parakoreensis]MCV7316776.1 DUF4349 domain-containing protein [Mycolicibacillus parakoreensis]ULN51148.1 DUF4349 domain-containing protein [Mycolicibacillus parakoreensis]HLR99729.1 DUF4349 domain-containing protein [Mycolicibacillus parakoreensis]